MSDWTTDELPYCGSCGEALWDLVYVEVSSGEAGTFQGCARCLTPDHYRRVRIEKERMTQELSDIETQIEDLKDEYRRMSKQRNALSRASAQRGQIHGRKEFEGEVEL